MQFAVNFSTFDSTDISKGVFASLDCKVLAFCYISSRLDTIFLSVAYRFVNSLPLVGFISGADSSLVQINRITKQPSFCVTVIRFLALHKDTGGPLDFIESDYSESIGRFGLYHSVCDF